MSGHHKIKLSFSLIPRLSKTSSVKVISHHREANCFLASETKAIKYFLMGVNIGTKNKKMRWSQFIEGALLIK